VELVQAFEAGRPDLAWETSQKLIHLAREAVLEAARSRFKVNFGSTRCDHCEGLRAGPGVVATCFQVRQCYYDNIKGTPSSKQELVVRRLMEE
jgi:hypothetical protein